MSFGSMFKSLTLTTILGVVAVVSAGAVYAQQSETENLPADVLAPQLVEEKERRPDLARGEFLFKACRKCHEIEPDAVKIGPSLAGVVGRRPGSIPDFGYSQDMIDYGASGAVWNEESLDRFLTKPRSLISGTKMVFQGFRKPADRDDLIAYLSRVRG